MELDKWHAFLDYLRDRIGHMHDDASPSEIVTWLYQTWHLDRDRPSRDEVLRHCLEYTVAEVKKDLPTWWQLHQARLTGQAPAECEPKVTPRPRGAGLFVESMDELRADVVRNGLSVIEGDAKIRPQA